MKSNLLLTGKSNLLAIFVVLVSASSVLIAPSSYGAIPIKPGAACTKSGAKGVANKVNYTCKKVAGKLVWVMSDAIESETFLMPKVVGMNLQKAQDLLQSLGSYLMDQTDASGLGRLQILDRNWKVCAQAPLPGKNTPITTIVTLASVKLTESCP